MPGSADIGFAIIFYTLVFEAFFLANAGSVMELDPGASVGKFRFLTSGSMRQEPDAAYQPSGAD